MLLLPGWRCIFVEGRDAPSVRKQGLCAMGFIRPGASAALTWSGRHPRLRREGIPCCILLTQHPLDVYLPLGEVISFDRQTQRQASIAEPWLRWVEESYECVCVPTRVCANTDGVYGLEGGCLASEATVSLDAGISVATPCR